MRKQISKKIKELRGGGRGSGLSLWKKEIRDSNWKGRPGHVPEF